MSGPPETTPPAGIDASVGLDFGGTNIKAGRVSASGEVLGERSIPIELSRGAHHVYDQAAELARSLSAEGMIGVGCAGLFDHGTGTVLASPNLTELVGTSLTSELGRRLDVRVVLENDANVAAVGEQWLGAAKGEDDLLLVTLGTGIGGALILGGALFSGPSRGAGEIGHVVVEPGGRQCGCGSHGCLETLASATAARRRAIAAGLPSDDPGNLERLGELARQAAGPERDLMFAIGRDLGYGLAYVANLLDLDCFVFGGGFSATLEELRPGILAGLEERAFGQRAPRLLRATLGGSAGWIGAARLALV
ncbi:MAG: ROK family protein [bacterium]|nr:ROK family protein [bacterium]